VAEEKFTSRICALGGRAASGFVMHGAKPAGSFAKPVARGGFRGLTSAGEGDREFKAGCVTLPANSRRMCCGFLHSG
jgi:hypothetical protein